MTHNEERSQKQLPQTSNKKKMEIVGLDLYFEELPLGRKFQTIGRTMTEADIVNFVNFTGMTEMQFTDMEYLEHIRTLAVRSLRVRSAI